MFRVILLSILFISLIVFLELIINLSLRLETYNTIPFKAENCRLTNSTLKEIITESEYGYGHTDIFEIKLEYIYTSGICSIIEEYGSYQDAYLAFSSYEIGTNKTYFIHNNICYSSNYDESNIYNRDRKLLIIFSIAFACSFFLCLCYCCVDKLVKKNSYDETPIELV